MNPTAVPSIINTMNPTAVPLQEYSPSVIRFTSLVPGRIQT